MQLDAAVESVSYYAACEERTRWFRQQMLGKLRINEHKGLWDAESDLYLFRRMEEEGVELLDAMDEGDLQEIIKEAADVANFAMMIATNAGRRLGQVL